MDIAIVSIEHTAQIFPPGPDVGTRVKQGGKAGDAQILGRTRPVDLHYAIAVLFRADFRLKVRLSPGNGKEQWQGQVELCSSLLKTVHIGKGSLHFYAGQVSR